MWLRIGKLIVCACAFFLGGFTFLALSDFALIPEAWCVAGEPHCVRDWIGALSGWAAAVAASVTILVLLTQAAAARQAVETARETLVASRESSERQLRAYVFFARASARDFDIDEVPKIAILVKNFGQTPAYNVTVTHRWALTEPNSDRLAPLGITHTMGDLGPTQEIDATFHFDRVVIDDSWNRIAERSTILKVWFDFSYIDEFKQHRVTSSCLAFEPDGNGDGRFILVAGGTRFR